MDQRSVLSIRDADLEIDGRLLWRNLNLDVASGEFIAIIGANGSGKTSLLQEILFLGRLKMY